MVPLNFTLRLTLMLLVSVPFTILFLLMPFLLLLPLGRVGCETLGEAVKGFKSLIWSTKEGKRIVVFMIIVETIMYLFANLSFIIIYDTSGFWSEKCAYDIFNYCSFYSRSVYHATLPENTRPKTASQTGRRKT